VTLTELNAHRSGKRRDADLVLVDEDLRARLAHIDGELGDELLEACDLLFDVGLFFGRELSLALLELLLEDLESTRGFFDASYAALKLVRAPSQSPRWYSASAVSQCFWASGGSCSRSVFFLAGCAKALVSLAIMNDGASSVVTTSKATDLVRRMVVTWTLSKLCCTTS
jgi:hypothetical protein